MVPLDHERVPMQGGRSSLAEPIAGLHVPEVLLPLLVAVEIEAKDAVRTEGDPNVFPVGDRRGRSESVIAVVSLVAPVWEEFIFRGFLLPSFTRYFRADVSILLSSLIFALAHFSIERLIPLTFLGMLMCVVYLRSKNILAPIILHSLWNAFAFVELVIKPEAAATWITNLFGMGV